jgi:hypothetical protein
MRIGMYLATMDHGFGKNCSYYSTAYINDVLMC